jgi:hypothetical protein
MKGLGGFDVVLKIITYRVGSWLPYGYLETVSFRAYTEAMDYALHLTGIESDLSLH